MSNLPPPRRIVTSNLIIPGGLSKLENPEPAVQVVTEEIPLVSEAGGQWFGRPVFTHDRVPTSNAGSDISMKPIPGDGLRLPHGANVRFNEVPPGGRTPMVSFWSSGGLRKCSSLLTADRLGSQHRTSTTDYNVFLTGTMVLVTPAEAYDPGAPGEPGELRETVCRPGDVVVQRGTMHA